MDHRRGVFFRGNGLNAAVLLIGHIIERGHIAAFDLRQGTQQPVFVPAFFFGLLHSFAHLRQLHFAFAQHHHIKEVCDGFSIADARPAGDNQGPVLVPVF